jgi:hypothetical protein
VTAATRDRTLFVLSLAIGVAGWWGAAAVSGPREAWDGPSYWQAVVPATYVLCALFGYLGSRGAWRWPFLAFGAQVATMLVRGGGAGNLFPLGLALFAVMAAIGLVPAYLGVALRRARDRSRAAAFAAKARRDALAGEPHAGAHGEGGPGR